MVNRAQHVYSDHSLAMWPSAVNNEMHCVFSIMASNTFFSTMCYIRSSGGSERKGLFFYSQMHKRDVNAHYSVTGSVVLMLCLFGGIKI